MTAARNAVFCVDGRPQSGLGHLSRCGALEAALVREGWTVEQVVDDGATDLARALSGWPTRSWDLLVVDHYGLDRDFEGGFRARAGRILAMDDGTGRCHDCDLLLDAAADARAYDGLVPAGCLLLAGPAYALLPKASLDARAAALARDRAAAPVRAAVYLGGAEDGRLAGAVLDALAAAAPDLAVDLVLPAAAAQARLGAIRAGVTVHGAQPGLTPLLAAADIAVGTAGVTAWERCCLGLPSLAIVTADNQRGVAARLREAGAAIVIDRVEAEDFERLTRALAALLADGAARCRMARAAAALCDGEGPLRTVEAIAGATVERRRAGAGRC